jgi:hypothetical protein
MAVAAIKCHWGTAGAQIAQCVQMRTDKVADVDVIADTGTIRRRIIRAIDVELRSKPERCFKGDFNQLGCVLRRLPGTALRIGAGNVEVA